MARGAQVFRELLRLGCRTLLSTHYHALCQVSSLRYKSDAPHPSRYKSDARLLPAPHEADATRSRVA